MKTILNSKTTAAVIEIKGLMKIAHISSIFATALFTATVGLISSAQAATLVAHYEFEDTTLTNGSTISNSLSANGTIEGGNLASTTGVFGNALNLNGTGYVDLGSTAAVQQTGSFTISFWVTNGAGTLTETIGVGAAGNSGMLGAADGIGSGNNGFLIKPQEGGRLFFDSTNNGTANTANLFADPPKNILALDTNWNFVAVRFTQGTGVTPGSFSMTTSNALANPLGLTASDFNTSSPVAVAAGDYALWKGNLAIGARDGTGAGQFDFTIDDLRIYDGALTDIELAASAVPEPSAAGLMALAFASLMVRRRRA